MAFTIQGIPYTATEETIADMEYVRIEPVEVLVVAPAFEAYGAQNLIPKPLFDAIWAQGS